MRKRRLIYRWIFRAIIIAIVALQTFMWFIGGFVALSNVVFSLVWFCIVVWVGFLASNAIFPLEKKGGES